MQVLFLFCPGPGLVGIVREFSYFCKTMAIAQKIRVWYRLFAIYCELGYIPWRKPAKERKPARKRKHEDSVYIGAREAIIPFLNDDAKRTFSHLLLRPGYMLRDYIQRGRHGRYLAPFTSLLVFYSLFTLLMAVVQPKPTRSSIAESAYDISRLIEEQVDSLGKDDWQRRFIVNIAKGASTALIITQLDLFPEGVDTPWKQSLAAVEGDLRSKGIPLFLDNFLFMWLAMAVLLRKKYKVSMSGAAAASAYVLCQFCLFMFLALLLSFGQDAKLGILLTAVLVFIDYRQWLKVDNRTAFWLTVKTGILNAVFRAAFFLLLGLVLVGIAYART